MVGLLVGVGLGVEVAAIQPELVDTVFHLARIILFCEFFHCNLPNVLVRREQKSRPTEISHGTAVKIHTAVPPKLHTACGPRPLMPR